jgi:protein O-mannosyl-transferase
MNPRVDRPMSRRNERWIRWGLLCCTAAVYSVGFHGPFQFDDSAVVVRDESVHSLAAALDHLGSGLRPLLKLSYALSWAVAGGASWPFHVGNLLVHLVNVELVLRLATAALHPSRAPPFRGLTPAAALTGALFALHPIQTEAVTYISGRSSSLSTLFVLVALLFYVSGLRAARAPAFYFAALVAFTLALLTKEAALTLPLALLTWELCVERSRPKAIARRLGLWFGIGLLGALAAVMHPRYFALLREVVGQKALLEALNVQLGGVAYLASRLFLVESPCIDPGLGVNPPAAWVGWLTLLVLLALGVLLWRTRARPVLLFGLTFFLLQVLVPYVLLPRVDVVNERHVYSGTVGLFLMLGALWDEFDQWAPRLRLWLPLAVLLGLAVLTVRRNLDYSSELALWQSTVRCAPKNPRAFNNLGVAHERSGNLALARVAFARAIALEPRYAAARDNFIRATHKQSLRDGVESTPRGAAPLDAGPPSGGL